MRSVGKVFSPLEFIQIGSGQIVLHIVPSQVIVNDWIDLLWNGALNLVKDWLWSFGPLAHKHHLKNRLLEKMRTTPGKCALPLIFIRLTRLPFPKNVLEITTHMWYTEFERQATQKGV